MAGVAHLLAASITSALALKPSTVYVVRVENSKTRATWHLRKCFSEFCELRDKVIALIDGTSSATTSSSSSSSPGSTTTTSGSSSTSTGNASSYDSSHTCSSSSGSESYLESAITHASSCSSSITISSSSSDRFPFLYKQFPRRQLFGSRSKKVIEQRTHALDAFVRQLLLYVREMKQQNQIAVYFSMMNFVETFFECAAHSSSDVGSHSSNYGTTTFDLSTFSLNSPSTLAKTQAAAAAAARAAVAAPQGFYRHQQPHQPPFSFHDYEDDEDDSASDRDSDVVVAPADVASNKNNFNFASQFYQEYGKTITTQNDDDEETKLVLGLKKTASCIAHRGLKEMKMHFSGSHYAPMQSTDVSATKFASGRKNSHVSASDTWTARIAIAGFSTVAAASSAAGTRNAQVQNSSKLAIGANRVAVRHHPNHSSNKKSHSHSSTSTTALPVKHQFYDNDQSQTQAASIVYATKQQYQDTKALMVKHKQLHASAAAGRRRAAREERPEWA